jgi:hypothetical protein
MPSPPLALVCLIFSTWNFMAHHALAADAVPDTGIELQVSIAGRPATGLIALGHSVNMPETLSPAQKQALDKGFAAALVPFRPGARIPFSVKVRLPGHDWTDVTADGRLYVDITLSALTFDPAGALIAKPAPGMPDITSGQIVAVHVFFFPDQSDRKRFGYDEYYLRASE